MVVRPIKAAIPAEHIGVSTVTPPLAHIVERQGELSLRSRRPHGVTTGSPPAAAGSPAAGAKVHV